MAPKAGSSDSSASALPPAAEAKLNAVPDVIGGADPASPDAAGEVDSITGDDISALMAGVAFEEQDVRDLLGEFFEMLASRFESEHWKLTDRQSQLLGKPATILANSLWVKLTQIIPDIIARWCESTPGAVAFLTAAGIVIGPKIMRQIQVSRARRLAAGEERREHVREQRKPVAQAVSSDSFVREYRQNEEVARA